MSFDQKELEKVARLARLKLSAEESARFQEELGRIVDFVAELNEVNTDGVEPMSHADHRVLFFRKDEPKAVLGQRCVSSSAGYEDGLVRVPKIIE